MFIHDNDLPSIIKVPLFSWDFQFAETTLRGIIRESESLADLNMKAGREYLALLEEGRDRVAELFDNLSFWAYEMDQQIGYAPR